MIKQNLDFSTAFNAFQQIDALIREYALKHCEFKEKIPNKDDEYRRPVVCIRTKAMRDRVNQLTRQWFEARDNLHELEPNRFPLNSAIFNPAPSIVGDITCAQLYVNTATNSRIIGSDKILGRLGRMRRSYSSKKESAMYDETLEAIERDIKFFEEHKDEKFRLRSTGYTEVISAVVTDGGEELKLKVPDIGIFLDSKNSSFSVYQPDQKPQEGVRQKRFSIYDELLPVQTVLPLTGDLFAESEIIKAKADEERRKKMNDHN
ncbi:hypothetical protein I3271_05545 [Photobacterium leiognathi]|uniref:hypothetical protein n=1 Tax=Photobacterium leiognathi TaxID=553611 RepID=UPI001EE072CE|nr:hypothetical protein [Photobacterium leiognathi]MCG3884145.1 hypothetical protein [Photobacterium leiognathi]